MGTWLPDTCREYKDTYMKNCASGWLFTKIMTGCTVNKTLKKYKYSYLKFNKVNVNVVLTQIFNMVLY